MTSRFASLVPPCGVMTILAAGLLAGCSLKQPSPAKQAYVLDAVRSGEARARTSAVVLRVRDLHVAAPFEGRGFVYRTSDLGYRVDFYHEFLTAPRNLIAAQLQNWLSASGLFQVVLSSSGAVEATHAIDGNISALYGDFRNPSSPMAVVAAEFIISNQRGGDAGVVFHKSYHQEVPLTGREPEVLAKGWTRAVENIFTSLEADVAAAQLK